MPALRHPLANAAEDPEPRGTARLSADEAAPAGEDRSLPTYHPRHTSRRKDGADEAAAYGPPHLAAAARRTRVQWRLHDRQRRRPGAEGWTAGGVPTAVAPARGS